jgi:hypothetical protein
MAQEDRSQRNADQPLIRRDAGNYSLRWKVCYGAAWLLAYCVFYVALRYFGSDDSVGETLSSPEFYLSALVTLAGIVAIYWFMTDRSGTSRRDS